MYSEKFEEAFEYVIENEGEYVDDPHDSGGETKWGICKRSYPHLDIKKLSLNEVKEIYHRDFWERGKYEDITDTSLAVKLFDLSVNIGTKQSNILIQRALQSVGEAVIEDGIVGAITLAAINKSPPRELLAALKSESAGYYRLIAAKNPSQKKFLNGWLNRAYRKIVL